jgi:hypothetical protein
MRYDFQRVAMDVPLVLLDESSYRYDDKATARSVDVSWDPRDDDVDPATVLAPIVEQMKDALDEDLEVVSEGPAQLLLHPAKKIALRIRMEGGDLGMWMIGSGTRPAALVVSYSAPGFGPQGQKVFEHVAGSIAPAERPWTRKGAQGYVRRQAGRITLEVPRDLRPPQEFRFRTRDSAVRVLVHFPAALQPRPREFTDLAPFSEPGGELRVAAEEEKPATIAGWAGVDSRWELERVEGEEVLETAVVRRLALRLGPTHNFHLTGVAAAQGVRVLDSVWPQLTGTLTAGA